MRYKSWWTPCALPYWPGWKVDEDDWIKTFEAKEPVPNHTEYYVVNPFYWSSEREPHVHVGSAEKMAPLMEQILQPKGYKILNGLDLTKAFTFDTATQTDGLHIIGPPMKMLLTMVFHDLCMNVVNGSVV